MENVKCVVYCLCYHTERVIDQEHKESTGRHANSTQSDVTAAILLTSHAPGTAPSHLTSIRDKQPTTTSVNSSQSMSSIHHNNSPNNNNTAVSVWSQEILEVRREDVTSLPRWADCSEQQRNSQNKRYWKRCQHRKRRNKH